MKARDIPATKLISLHPQSIQTKMLSSIFQEHILLRVLLLLFCLLTEVTTITSISSNSSSGIMLAKPDCRDRCGNVTIPYPFGIGDGCYYDETFEITCNDSSHPSRAFLKDATHPIQIQKLSLDHYASTDNGYAKRICYDNQTGQGNQRQTYERIEFRSRKSDGPFTISTTRNKFIVIGCDIFANIPPDPSADDNNANYRTGCASFCYNRTTLGPTRGGFPCLGGNGCCQASIPDGMKNLSVSMNSLNTDKKSWTFHSCSYAFVVDNDFSGLHKLADQKSGDEEHWRRSMPLRLPLIADWAIGKKTCKEAKRDPSSYACGNKSDCVESNNGPGYRCKCSQGFQGNPYLPNGCQDIDECKESSNTSTVCQKKEYCVNREGSYSCACPSKYHGDASKLGSGCTRDLPVGVTVSIGIAIGIALICLIAIAIWLYHRLEKKHRYFKKNGGMLLKQKISSKKGRVGKAKIFTIEELKRATDNFNKSRIIGKGGFGTVYKGMLSDGRIIAVKKSKLVDESQVDQFINEVVIISQINHRHIVKFLGCCLQTQVPLLVYEFVSNGTLSYHLHGEGGGESSISWKDRLRIASEVAGALTYLHAEASVPIFHRDIKSNNILLDVDYKAKVSDFGISRSVPLDETHLTTVVQGTFGYLDPEYFCSGQFTEKSDVYSFGVVLVELLTGEKAISLIRSKEEQSLALHFISIMRDNRLLDILDARVVNEGNRDEALVVAKLAQRCLKVNGTERPTMKEVAERLDGLRRFQEHPWVNQNEFQEEEIHMMGSILEDQGFESNNSTVSIV